RAAEFGLSAVPMNASGDTLYFGLAGTNSVDGREIIGFFQPDKEQFLEYDIASLIYRLGNPKRPAVGLISTLSVDPSFDQMSGRMQEGWASIGQLRELFDVRTIATDVASIDPEISVLVVIHPKNLSEQTLYAIDQFVMRGGKLLAFVDPQAENDTAGAHMGMMPPMGGRSSSLGPLLDAYGISYDPNTFVGDRELGMNVALRQGEFPTQHIEILSFNRASMNREDVVTAALDSVNTWSVGSLKKKDDATIEFEPLLQSSGHAALLPTSRRAVMPTSNAPLEGVKATGERYTVAARIRGKLKSAFPNGKPGSEGDGASDEHRAETAEEANLIIVADTDLLADPLWLRTQNLFGQRFAIAWA